MDYTYQDVAKMIDHSLLNPTLTVAELDKGIQIALDYDVASVCIMPYALKHCAEQLQGSAVKAGTTIGFPHGGHTTAIKVAEAEQALADGGEELDMMVNISRVLSGEWDAVAADIRGHCATPCCRRLSLECAGQTAYCGFENRVRNALLAGWCSISGDSAVAAFTGSAMAYRDVSN